PPDAKRIAQTASVIGDEFWVDALARLEPGLSPESIDAALRELSDRELIEPVERPSLPNERGCRFRQALVREVSYTSVPKQIRARQHALLGSWLESVAMASGMERDLAD